MSNSLYFFNKGDATSMKKEVKAIIAVVLAVWILVMGIEIGSLREKKKIAAANSTTTTTTTTPTTTQPATPITPNGSDIPGNATTTPSASASTTPSAPVVSTPANTVDVSTLSKEQIVAKVAESVNKVKSEQNMTARKVENTTITLTSLSAEGLRSIINSVISNLAGDPEDITINVANGTATFPDGSTMPVREAIPPSNEATKDFSLTADGVANATAVKQGDNTVYTLTLVAEETTAASPIPTHKSKAIGYLNLMSFNDELPAGAQIVNATMKYPGSTVEVTVNPAGQVVRLACKLPMTGYGEAKLGFISGNANFEGANDEVWEFTY